MFHVKDNRERRSRLLRRSSLRPWYPCLASVRTGNNNSIPRCRPTCQWHSAPGSRDRGGSGLSSSTVSQSFRDLTMRDFRLRFEITHQDAFATRLRWTISSIHAAAGNNANNLPRSLFVFPRYNSLRQDLL
jgi:hypothetical protein